jgi:hypothetical protein
MTATETQPLIETYVKEQAVSNFLSVFAYVDKEQGIDESFGSLGGNAISNMVGVPLWTELNPGDDPSPEVEYGDARAALLAARLCRILIDDPELLPYRAAHLEQWAAGVFARQPQRAEATDAG